MTAWFTLGENMTDRPIVVVPSDDPSQCQGSPRLKPLENRAEIRIFPTKVKDFDELVERSQGAMAVINSRSYVRWGKSEFDALPELKFITTCGIGTDSIDLDQARDRGIVVSNVPGKTAPVVAEHAFGLMFAAAKRVVFYTDGMRSGRWGKRDGVFLQGKTAGIIGTGNIGAEMARLCRSFGMNVLAWTFNPSPERAQALGVKYVSLDELLSSSDVVSIHVALTDDSRGLLGARELGLMKPEAILVNVARGPVVDEPALVAALNDGKLGAAALDVFSTEPLPADSPLLKCEQIVLTPHVADMTPEGLDLLNEGVVDNVLAFLSGAPRNIVT